MSTADFKKNFTKPFIVVLYHTRAYTYESGIKSAISAHSSNLSVSSDKNPLINMCTTLHWEVNLFLFKDSVGFVPDDKQTNLIWGRVYLRGGRPSNNFP